MSAEPLLSAALAMQLVLDQLEFERQRQELLSLLPADADPLDHNAFQIRNGRVPVLGEEVPPWKYSGWLRHSVQLLHVYGGEYTAGFPDRWGYFGRTLEAGHLLDDPIPRVEFQHADPGVLRETEKWVSILEAKGSSHWTAFSELLEFLGYGLAVPGATMPRLDDRACEALYKAVKLHLWLKHPSDYLGTLASERYKGGPLAFFPTPHVVCEAMISVVAHDMRMKHGEDLRAQVFMEPCCGTGRFVLHASNYSLRARCIDLDPLMVLATKVNLAVYAPWMLYGLPFLEKNCGKAAPEAAPSSK